MFNRLSDQGDDLDDELAKKRANPSLHFEMALQHLRSEADLGVDFETQNNLLIDDLSALAASPGSLNIQVINYRSFLLERASYAFRSSVVS